MASNLRGYSADEVLNKVLNTSNDSIQVDIVAGAEYAEDSEHTSTDTGNFVLGVRNDTLAALGGTDGDYVPFQMNADGALYVEISSGGASDSIYVDDADWTDSTSKHTLVGGLYQSTPQSITDGDTGPLQVNANGNLIVDLSATDNAVLDAIDAVLDTIKTDTGTIDSDTDAIKTAVEAVNQAAEGTISATTQRVTIATDDDGVAHLATIAGAVSTQMQVDIVADGAGLATAANQLADGHNVTVDNSSIEVVGDAAENAAAAGNPVLTGGRYDSPGNDNATVRALGDNDVGALALDPTGALYVREYLGQTGSCFVSGVAAVTAAIGKFVAIQFLEDTVFNGTDGLVATDSGRWPDDTDAAVDISGSNTAAVGSQVFPQGMTIFGRWDSFILVSGAVIAYVGNV